MRGIQRLTRRPVQARAVSWLLLSLLGVLWAVGRQGSTTAAEPPNVDQAAVSRLITNLGDPQQRRREAATDALESLGIGILPQLEEALPLASAETAWRLRMLRSVLADRAVAAAIEPAHVPVTPAGTPISVALADLFEGPGGPLPLSEESLAPTLVPAPSSDFPAHPTYWEELERLLAIAHSRVATEATTASGLVIRPLRPDEPQPLATSAGPLRVELLRAVMLPSEKTTATRLTLRVLWEPRMHPVMLQLPMVSLIAEGEAGEVVPPQQRMAVAEASPRGQSGSVTLPILLAVPPEGSTPTLATLRGTLSLWVPAPDVEARFPLPPAAGLIAAPVLQLGDATVELGSLTIADGSVTVRMRAEYPATEALASHRTWITDRTLFCRIDGSLIAATSDRVVHRRNTGLTREAVFPLPQGSNPQAVSGEVGWQVPLAIRDVPVDFLLRGIPLPFSSDAKTDSDR